MTTNIQDRTEAERRHELRRKLGVTQPELHRFPQWLRPRVNAVGLRPYLPPGCGNYGCHSGWQACTALEHHICGFGSNQLFDHHGRLRRTDGTWMLVSEPYATLDDPKLIAAVEAVSELLMLNHCITSASWWNPPATIRISWWPRHGQVERVVRAIIRKRERDKTVSVF